MMRLLYSLLTAVAAPAVFATTLLRSVKHPAHRAHLIERFGWGPRLHAPSIWLHAVSLGEVSAAAALVRALRERHPGVPFVLSTATRTGRAQAAALFGADIEVRFLPYDTPGSVRRFLARIRPRMAIIMETELWPNLLRGCDMRGVPVLFASARLAARSVPRYRRFGALFSAAVRNAWVAAQSEADAERFIAIGAERARTHVVGNVKFDMRLGEAVAARGRDLRRLVLGARPVWTAGSTHDGEEELVLDAHAALLGSMVAAPGGGAAPGDGAAPGGAPLLVLVPRHPERFESVASLLEKRGVAFDRRSGAASVRAEAQVLLVDRMGELTAFYAASDVAFVGGSLVPVGGHNLLEPAALGVPAITGPYTANGPEIARRLIEAGGAVEVADGAALGGVVARLMAEPALRARMGECARHFVEAHRGSLVRLLALIEPLLGAD